jgi:hypothetical protein
MDTRIAFHLARIESAADPNCVWSFGTKEESDEIAADSAWRNGVCLAKLAKYLKALSWVVAQ